MPSTFFKYKNNAAIDISPELSVKTNEYYQEFNKVIIYLYTVEIGYNDIEGTVQNISL